MYSLSFQLFQKSPAEKNSYILRKMVGIYFEVSSGFDNSPNVAMKEKKMDHMTKEAAGYI
jgi:hypothetical protein